LKVQILFSPPASLESSAFSGEISESPRAWGFAALRVTGESSIGAFVELLEE
jgi:hypothetical protein